MPEAVDVDVADAVARARTTARVPRISAMRLVIAAMPSTAVLSVRVPVRGTHRAGPGA